MGAAGRHLFGLIAARMFGLGFPWGTLGVNLIGSFVMGLVIAVLALRDPDGTNARLFLATGILGGFTTFSAFSLETMTLIERGATGQAALYIGLSVILSIGALALGLFLARGIFA